MEHKSTYHLTVVTTLQSNYVRPVLEEMYQSTSHSIFIHIIYLSYVIIYIYYNYNIYYSELFILTYSTTLYHFIISFHNIDSQSSNNGTLHYIIRIRESAFLVSAFHFQVSRIQVGTSFNVRPCRVNSSIQMSGWTHKRIVQGGGMP